MITFVGVSECSVSKYVGESKYTFPFEDDSVSSMHIHPAAEAIEFEGITLSDGRGAQAVIRPACKPQATS